MRRVLIVPVALYAAAFSFVDLHCDFSAILAVA